MHFTAPRGVISCYQYCPTGLTRARLLAQLELPRISAGQAPMRYKIAILTFVRPFVRLLFQGYAPNEGYS